MKKEVTGVLKQKRWPAFLPFAVLLSLTVLLVLLFFFDNKYQTPPPYGARGVFPLTESDIKKETPVFLIDGWLITDQRNENDPTYIGQYASLNRGKSTISPHGKASYELTLRYQGEPIEAAVNFSQLFSQYKIFFDGALLSEGTGGTRIAVHLAPGDHLLRVETVSTHGYYSGMYHPPAIGTIKAVDNLIMFQGIAYGVALLVPLTLALFTLALWWRSKDRTIFWFGLLCLSFSAYVSYHFVRVLGLSVGEYWYLIQSTALYCLCLCALRLTAVIGSLEDRKPVRWVQRIGALLAMVLILLSILTGTLPWASWLHGIFTDVFYIFTFYGVLMITVWSRNKANLELLLTRLGCLCFGMGLLCNLFGSGLLSALLHTQNLFEPIRFFWQFEWCALFLVLLFGAMMVARNRRILAENLAFQNHLEEMVEQRTEELRNLLQERKMFFADMAHDLKAPLFAASSFIQLIRANDTGVDDELLHYIDMVEQKQKELLGRVQGLTVFNKMDELDEPFEEVSVQKLLADTAQAYRIAMRAQSVHFEVVQPENDGYLYAQPKKLYTMFENLIFNAMRATPPDGTVSVVAELDDGYCHFSVEDTGCGIPFHELSHIFDRFFVGAKNNGTGSGLGLYIVKSIVTELKGEISVSSEPGQGTVFYIDLPLMDKEEKKSK